MHNAEISSKLIKVLIGLNRAYQNLSQSTTCRLKLELYEDMDYYNFFQIRLNSNSDNICIDCSCYLLGERKQQEHQRKEQ